MIPEKGERDGSLSIAFLGVGSNISPEENILALVQILKATPSIHIRKISTFYRTAPLSAPGEPKGFRRGDSAFLNGVLEIGTSLTPSALLRVLQGLEVVLGRVRTEDRYAPRSMDLDLLLFLPGSAPSSPEETDGIHPPPPHPEIFQRAFVAVPLFELAPDLVLPPDGIPLREIVDRVPGPGGEEDRSFSAGLQALLSLG